MATKIRKIISHFFGNIIIMKTFKGFHNSLTYNFSQHLVFFWKRKIVYEPEIWRNIKGLIKPNSLIFDIGANIGQYAIRFNEQIGNENSGRIICVEPDPGNLSYIYFNKYMNQCKNIEILNVGIAPSIGKMTLYRDISYGGRLSSFKPDKNLVPFNVETVTIDYLISKYGIPDFVKIDVEGFEIEVLNSMSSKNIKNL